MEEIRGKVISLVSPEEKFRYFSRVSRMNASKRIHLGSMHRCMRIYVRGCRMHAACVKDLSQLELTKLPPRAEAKLRKLFNLQLN